MKKLLIIFGIFTLQFANAASCKAAIYGNLMSCNKLGMGVKNTAYFYGLLGIFSAIAFVYGAFK